MRLFVITQTVDRKDPILGFMHRWIEALASRVESVLVVCLKKGEYAFPPNVRVISLGKESGLSKSRQLANFFKVLWKERRSYDTVFVHMNEIYVILGGLIWRASEKRIAMWRNHPVGTWMTPVAMRLANQLFCTSSQSFIASSPKTILMPAGIDTDAFSSSQTIVRDSKKIVMAGRINESYKRTHVLIAALIVLAESGIRDWTCDLYGEADAGNEPFLESLKQRVRGADLQDHIRFLSSVTNARLVAVYQSAGIVVNTTQSGSLDKAILEAMSAGCLVAVSNDAFRGKIGDAFLFADGDSTDLSVTLRNLLAASESEATAWRNELRAFVTANHSLTALMDKLIYALNN